MKLTDAKKTAVENADWGPWKLNPETLQLVHSAEGYEVSMPSCKSSAEILDWIFQIQGKSWADAETVKGLLQALDDILKPQAHFCSGGKDKKASGEDLAKQYVRDPGALDKLLRG
jgi:hypothetical protein